MSNNNSSVPEVKPYIAHNVKLPETTVKAIILGIILAAILAGANAYFGLFAGMTVSATIPAAVISMAILSIFRKHNILENNMVMTIASAGEALAAGVIFTLPALVIMGYWKDGFDYLYVTLISGLGGVIGVLFTIPIRRALIINTPLAFPEGKATAEVLKSGEERNKGEVKYLIFAALTGGLMKLASGLFKLWPGTIQNAWKSDKSIFYLGMDMSPALLGVGYIIGLNIAVLVFIGGCLAWVIGLPILSDQYSGLIAHFGDNANIDAAETIWSEKIRIIGVGGMIIGGLWTILKLIKPIAQGIGSGISAYRNLKKGDGEKEEIKRTEKDAPMQWVLFSLAVCVIPIYIIYYMITGYVSIAITMAFIMIIAGFVFSAVGSYMAGLVGSSNNPISGITVATILFSSIILLALLNLFGDIENTSTTMGAAAAIMVGAVVCCAASIGADNMQDLKCGQIVGATPAKQQIMLAIGVIVSALVLAPILNLLNSAYGFGPDSPLKAPQANVMHQVALGIFEQKMDWVMILIGMSGGLVFIVLDVILEAKKSKFRTPVLAVAVGMYLPFSLAIPIVIGGFLNFLISYIGKRKHIKDKNDTEKACENSHKVGTLFGAGLITGEALMGVLIAIPIVIAKAKGINSLALFDMHPIVETIIGLAIFIFVIIFLYRVGIRGFKNFKK